MALPGRPFQRLFKLLFAKAESDTATYPDGTQETLWYNQGWLRNPTIVGAVVTVGSFILGRLGITIDEVQMAGIQTSVIDLATTLSALFTTISARNSVVTPR